MARRRRTQAASSLDLFLDTICNAFGGIIFISILIAVMAQMRGNAPPPTDVPMISEEQAAIYSKQFEVQSRELSDLKISITALEKQIPTTEQKEFTELQERIIEAQKNLDAAVQKQMEDSKKLADIQSKISKHAEDSEELERKLVEARAAMQAKSQAMDSALNADTARVPLPSVQKNYKANLLMAMRYGKLFMISDPSASSAETLFQSHLTVSTSNGEIRVAPKPGSGWDLNNPDEAATFESKIASKVPEETFFTVAVWSDSFKEFQKYKEIVIRMGYEYQLVPLDDVVDVPIRKGSSPTTQ